MSFDHHSIPDLLSFHIFSFLIIILDFLPTLDLLPVSLKPPF